jgi:formylglycine-generating enzyme required for sulfatase activity
MKQILLMIAVVALVGCGSSDTIQCYWCKEDVKKGALICKHCGKSPGEKTTFAETTSTNNTLGMVFKPEPPKVEPQKQVPPKVEANKPEAKIPANAFVNTLGMPFVPVPGTDVQFCIWETRVKDYAAYAAANAETVFGRWKSPGIQQEDTHPVVKVNWNDANAFCAWLTKKELAAGKIKAGQKYRLPTDAEWSVAVGLDRLPPPLPASTTRRSAPSTRNGFTIEDDATELQVMNLTLKVWRQLLAIPHLNHEQ